MTKKRRSGGRTGSSSGRDQRVQCSKCGRMVPRGKAKRVTHRVNLVDRTIAKELQEQGAILPNRKVTDWYCISCAIHTHKVHIRSEDNRRKHDRIR
jgi:small subunit ribosomal protein S26e